MEPREIIPWFPFAVVSREWEDLRVVEPDKQKEGSVQILFSRMNKLSTYFTAWHYTRKCYLL